MSTINDNQLISENDLIPEMENDTKITLYNLFFRFKSKYVLRLFFHSDRVKLFSYFDKNNRLIKDKLKRLKNYVEMNIEKEVKIVWLVIFGDVRRIVTNHFSDDFFSSYPNIKVVITTLDYPKVYRNMVKKVWEIPNLLEHKPNIHFLEVAFSKEVITKYILTLFKDVDDDHIHYFNNFATNMFFTENINENPIRKVLLIGSLFNGNIYPERENFYEYAKNNPQLCEYGKGAQQHREYIKIIRSYLCCFVGPICWRRLWNHKGYKTGFNDVYIPTKLFEFGAQGCLLLIHDNIKHKTEKIGFVNMETCIYTNESNYDEKVKFILDDKNKSLIDNIRERSQKLVLNNYMAKQKVLDFIDIFNLILEN